MAKQGDYGPLRATSSEPAALTGVPVPAPAIANAATEETDQKSEADESKFPSAGRSFATTGLFVLACLYTLYFAQDILMPIAIAVILFLILWPLVRALVRIRIPPPVGAAVVVLALFGAFAVGIYFLAEPATRWIAALPDVIEEIQRKMEDPVEQIKEAKKQVEEAITTGETDLEKTGIPQQKQDKEVEVPAAPEDPAFALFDIVGPVLTVISDIGWIFVIVVVLLYFLLAAGDTYQEKIVKALPTFRDKRRAVIVIRGVHRDVAIYLLTVTLINCGLGVAIGVAMYIIGLPNSVLWGVMAALLNFIPYFGPLVGQVLIGIVGLTVFENLLDALVPVGLYFIINMFEGYVVMPTVLGRSLTMNPMVVFLAVVVWGWLWGIPGALLAVPILACFNVICVSVERLQPWCSFLGR
ncbi:MAG: AI-2E family transporter [Hyphomicrobium sp.]